jgi:RimJ/RimL family protein N-acetyltransferase
LNADDIDDFLAYRSDPDVLRYQGMGPMSREKAMAFIEEMADAYLGFSAGSADSGVGPHHDVDLRDGASQQDAWKPGQWLQIAIVHSNQQKLIGDLALKLDAYEPRIAEIGFTINPAFQRKGYAAEAVRHLIQYLFAEKEIHRIIALVDVRNPASYLLLEKLGFRREAHYRKSYFDKINGAWFDEYRYGLLKEEYDF